MAFRPNKTRVGAKAYGYIQMTVAEVAAAPSAAPRPKEIGRNNFDFCRFWLAVLVIFSHAYALTEGDERNEPLDLMTRGQLSSGALAVGCFFSISGFLITHSWLRSSSAMSYLWKRVLRIYPGFIVAVLIGCFIVAPLASDHFAIKTRELVTLPIYLLALRPTEPAGVFANNPLPGAINGSLWTIPYEFKCYLAVMLAGVLGVLGTRRAFVAGFMVVTCIVSLVYPWYAIPALDRGAFAAIVGIASNWVRIFPYFVSGMTFYLYRDLIPYTRTSVLTVLAIVVVASQLPPAGNLLFPVGITYLLFWFCFHAPLHIDHWAKYGDFSYGIYLYAFPIKQFIVMKNQGITPLTLFAVATPLSIAAGVLSWHLVEKRFLKMKR